MLLQIRLFSFLLIISLVGLIPAAFATDKDLALAGKTKSERFSFPNSRRDWFAESLSPPFSPEQQETLKNIDSAGREKQILKLESVKSPNCAKALYDYALMLCTYDIDPRSPLIQKSFPFVDDLLIAIKLPNQSIRADEIDWIHIGEAVARFDTERSNRVFLTGLDAMLRLESKRNDVPQTAVAWVMDLAKQQKFSEVLKISTKFMDYLDKYPQSWERLGYKGALVNEAANALNQLNRMPEAVQMRTAFDKEKKDFDRHEDESKKQEFLQIMNNRDASTKDKISALMQRADYRVYKGSCDECAGLYKQAVQIIEESEPIDAARNYHLFGDVYKNLLKCGQGDLGKELVRRLIKLRVRLGLPDTSASPGRFCFHCASNPDQEMRRMIESCVDKPSRSELQTEYSALLKEFPKASIDKNPSTDTTK